MTDNEYDWVPVQARCSAFEVLLLLRSGCERDVEARNIVRDESQPKERYFTIASKENGSFHVMRLGSEQGAVEFSSGSRRIVVKDENQKLMMEATLTLNNEGQCRLKVGAEELTFWQFRKRALEDLFFNR